MSLFSRHGYRPSRRSRSLDRALRESSLSKDASDYLKACARAGEYAISLLPSQSVYRVSELTEHLREAMRAPEGRAQARRVATWAVLAEGYGAGGPGWEADLLGARRVIGLGDREWPIVQDLARPFGEEDAGTAGRQDAGAAGRQAGGAAGRQAGGAAGRQAGGAAGRLVRFSELSLDWLCEAVSGRSLRPPGDTRFWLVDEYARLYFAWRQVLLAALAERRRRLAPKKRLLAR